MEASYGQTRAALRGRVQPTSMAALLPTQKSSKWVVICHQRGANKGPNRTSRPNLLATSQWLGQLAALYPKGRRTSGSELLRASNWLQKTRRPLQSVPLQEVPNPGLQPRSHLHVAGPAPQMGASGDVGTRSPTLRGSGEQTARLAAARSTALSITCAPVLNLLPKPGALWFARCVHRTLRPLCA